MQQGFRQYFKEKLFENHGSFPSRPISGRGYQPHTTAPTDAESTAAAGDLLLPTVHRHCPTPCVGYASTGRNSSSLLDGMEISEARILPADLFKVIKQLLQGLRYQRLMMIF